MKFGLEINLDNDAFRGTSALDEIAFILRTLSYSAERGEGIYDSMPLVDRNGNTVGRTFFHNDSTDDAPDVDYVEDEPEEI